MKNKIKIRNYKKSDYGGIKKNLIEGGNFDKYIDTKKSLEAKIEEKPDSIIVAETDGEVVGNIFIVEDGWVSYLFRLAVNKKYRNKGVGSYLLEYAETVLKDKGYKYVSFFIDNEELEQYYLKRGYKIESEKRFQLFSKEL